MKGPEGNKNPYDCCKVPELIPKSIFEKCLAANPEPKGAPNMPPKGCCVSECVMNETKIMANGKLDKVAAVKYIGDQMKGDAEAIKVRKERFGIKSTFITFNHFIHRSSPLLLTFARKKQQA